MLYNMDIRKWILMGLVVLHMGWIAKHMHLVIHHQINPWRLGGYAMYTVPNPSVRLRIYDAISSMPINARRRQSEIAVRSTNPARTFRCAHASSAALRAFFGENTDLIGRNLVFAYSELKFVRSPPSAKRELQGVVEVTWQDLQHFILTSRFCGDEYVETVALS